MQKKIIGIYILTRYFMFIVYKTDYQAIGFAGEELTSL